MSDDIAPDRARPFLKWIAVAAVAALVVAAGAAYRLLRTERAPEGFGDRTAAGENGGASLDPADIVDVIPRDGIPAIDDPVFIDPEEATWLAEREPVIAVDVNDDARAYPLQIMTWHEIVNDTIDGRPVAVTFCPLCNTAIAFERPRIDGEVTTFGTSGKLIHSNLLMYDRATESLWPQVTGVALTGPEKGRSLERIPAPIVSWGDFIEAHPDGKVLSRDTGHERRYGENPYPGYDDVDNSPFLFSGETDGRLAAVERILGVTVKKEAVAFPYFRLRERAVDGLAVAETEVAGEPVVVLWKEGTISALDKGQIAASKDVGAAAAFLPHLDGTKLSFAVEDGAIIDVETGSEWNLLGHAVEGPSKGERLEPVQATDSFWFDWAAFHPDTEVWQP